MNIQGAKDKVANCSASVRWRGMKVGKRQMEKKMKD